MKPANLAPDTVTKLLPVSSLWAPDEWRRAQSKVKDAILKGSIAEGGIQQLLVVVPDGKRNIVAEGIRRMDIAPSLEITKVGAVIVEAPEGQEPVEFARRLRYMLNELRDDPVPSVRASLLQRLKEQFKMTNTAVAQYLGVDQDTITNWLAVTRYVPEIVSALDRGILTMQAARVFDGMSESGQKKVWKADGQDLMNSAGGRMHKELRSKYPPTKFPHFYREPDKIAARLGKAKTRRKRLVKPSYTPAEKQRLHTSLDMKEAALKDATADVKQYKAEIAAAMPILHAIKRTPELWKLVPDEMKPEIDRVLEIY